MEETRAILAADDLDLEQNEILERKEAIRSGHGTI
jgi:hypothetical protein